MYKDIAITWLTGVRGALLVLMVVALGILLTRFPLLFGEYMLPNIFPDTVSYVYQASEYIFGNQADASTRSPGYPLIIAFCLFFFGTVKSVISAHIVFTLLAGGCFILSVLRTFPGLVFPAGILYLLFVNTNSYQIYESAILTESPYTSMLIISLSSLIAGLKTRSSIWLLISSTAMILTIWVRPSGLFLVVIYIFVLLFLYRNHFPGNTKLAFSLPFALLFFSLCGYNYMVVKHFAISTFAGANLVANTLLIWEKNEKFDDWINQGIERGKNTVPKEDLDILYRSSDLEVIQRLHEKYFAYEMTFGKIAFPDVFSYTYGVNASDELIELQNKVYKHAILSHPETYAKIVVSELLHFYLNNILHNPDYYKSMGSRRQFWRNSFGLNDLTLSLYEKVFTDFSIIRNQALMDRGIIRGYAIQDSIGLNGLILRADKHLTNFSSSVMRDRIWIILFMFGCLVSIWLSAKKRFKETESFCLFLICTSSFGGALVVCLVEPSLTRYSLPLSFLYYYSFILLLGIMQTPIRRVVFGNNSKLAR